MNIEDFLINFVVNAKEAIKNNLAIKKSTDDVEESLKKVDKTGQQTDNTLQNLGASFRNTLLRYAGLGAIIMGVKAAAAQTEELGRVSKALGVNVEELNAWGNAVKFAGGKAEDFQQTLAKTKIKMSDLPGLADKLSGLKHEKALEIGATMGLDQGTILLLQRGRREVDAIITRQKELGLITKRDTEVTHKFNEQWENTTQAFQSVFRTVGTHVFPILTRVMQGFESLAQFFKKNTTAAKVLAVAIGVLFAVLFPKLALLSAIGAAFALLYEDFMVFKEGGDSVIGRMLARWPMLLPIFKAIGKAFSDVYDGFAVAGEGIILIWDGIVAAIEAVIGAVAKTIEAVKQGYSKVKGFLGLGKETEDSVIAGGQSLMIASNNPMAGITSNSITNAGSRTNKETNVDIGAITIQTQATDADGISTAFADSMRGEIERTLANLDNGVMA